MITGTGAGPVEGYGARRTWRSRLGVLRRLDWPLFLAVLALSVVGALLVRSATFHLLTEQGQDPESMLKRHVLNLLIGFVLGGVVTVLDYRLLRAYVPILYGVACVGLLAVLTPLGETINGSHSWIVLGGGFQVQPSEFAKVGLVVLLAMILGEPRDGEIGPGRRDVLLALVLAGVPGVLIMLQPDLGTTLVFIAVVLGMLAISGAQKRWLVGLVGGGCSLRRRLVLRAAEGVPGRPLHRVPAPGGRPARRRLQRPAGPHRGRVGRRVRQRPVPRRADRRPLRPRAADRLHLHGGGEELGFVGAAIIVVLLGVVLWRGLRIATQAADLFGTLVATGVVCWLGFQAFENIGMTIGIMPITGLPLPFISYGGSATFANMIAFGLLQAVHVRRAFD